MLLAIIITLSVLSAAGIGFLSGAYESLAWLWVLPISFLGTALALAAAVFLTLCIMAKAVDMEKPQEKDNKFYRLMINLVAELAIPALSMRVRTQGLEKTPREGRFLLVCNHLNELDPVLLLHYFRRSQLTFISKRENKNMFLVGPLMHKIQCQLINRENDREALKTILKCIDIIRQDKASLAVFPEGYISKDKKLHHFRSGVFKIAQKTQVPIVVCTLRNTNHIFHNAPRLKPTKIAMHLVDVISPQQYAGLTTVELGNRIYELMAQDLGPENVSQETEN